MSWESLFDRASAADVTESQIRDRVAERRADEGAMPDGSEGADE